MPNVADVVARASDAVFGRPLITNVLRGQLVEAMIALVLEAAWTWCAADYAGWDFERRDGVRLEVKQSAARQTWDPPAHGRASASFDIRPRSGRWEGARFLAEPGRSADLYVFAYHAALDATADHRDPYQWQFHVLPTAALPFTKRIGLSRIAGLAPPIDLSGLAAQIDAAAMALPARR